MNALDWADIEVIPAHAAFFFGDHEPGVLENAEMLHHRAAIEPGQFLANIASRHATLLQKVQDVAAIDARQGFEDFVILDFPRRSFPALFHLTDMLYFYNIFCKW